MKTLLSKLLACWGILVFLCAWKTTDPGWPYYQDFRLIQAQMSYHGVKFSWSWEECGEVNAYYWPTQNHVVMCEEMIPHLDPGVVRYIFAHEAAHAVIKQLKIPFTGSEETAADELAAYLFGSTGRYKDLRATGAFWAKLGRPENPLDDHPSDLKRAWTMICLADGAESEALDGGCIREWRRVVYSWNQLLGIE